MDNKTRRDILGKIKLIQGLMSIMEYDIDNIKSDVLSGETSNLGYIVQDTNMTLDNMIDVIVEIEYALYLKGYTLK